MKFYNIKYMRKQAMKKYKLTEEEQEILDYFAKNELLELPKKELEDQIKLR